ncbi:hypothetical protein AVEN_233125-1, partial [Araneus ventricosus]
RSNFSAGVISSHTLRRDLREVVHFHAICHADKSAKSINSCKRVVCLSSLMASTYNRDQGKLSYTIVPACCVKVSRFTPAQWVASLASARLLPVLVKNCKVTVPIGLVARGQGPPLSEGTCFKIS